MKKALILFIVVVLMIGSYGLYQVLLGGEVEVQVEETESVSDLLQGKWRAVDDVNSVIEFKDGEKIDYYSGQKMFEGIFGIDELDEHITVSDGEENFEYGIVELSEKNLSLMYLPRGNILKYEKVDN